MIVIELYYWPMPNGHKITIFCEEAGIPYTIKPVNIQAGEQFKPDFLKISPSNRMPVIVDTEPADEGGPLSVFESGAILIYLAEKPESSCRKIYAAASRRLNGSPGRSVGLGQWQAIFRSPIWRLILGRRSGSDSRRRSRNSPM